MNVIWFLIVFVGTAAMLFTDPDGAIRALLTGSKGAVDLALTLIATYGFWLGFFALLEKTGASRLVARALRPVIKRLFRGESPETERYIAMNMSANLLGLGNAATPMGVAAAQRMQTLSGSEYASDELCRLVVLNTASVQLLPATVAALRAGLGAAKPMQILPAVWLSSLLSVGAGLGAAALMARGSQR